MPDNWLMGALAAQDQYNPEEGAYQADLLRAQQPSLTPRLDPGLRRAPGDTEMRPAAQAFGETVGNLVIPQDPVDYAMMAALGPAGRLAGKGVRAGTLALGGVLGMSDEAQAGKLELAKKAVQGIKAFHSSPHDFEKFDVGKIGTGEGAQVYGHGLYFAENPAVSGQGGQYWQQFLGRSTGAERDAAEAFRSANFNRDEAIRSVQQHRERLHAGIRSGELDARDVAEAMQRIDMQERLLASGKPVGPRTYEVNIHADPAQMLDWDKPLHQQQALSDVERLARRMGAIADNSLTGKELYHSLGDKPAATAMLREAGIPGIKYLDEGSRPWAEERALLNKQLQTFEGPLREKVEQRLGNLPPLTSNYVVFDPSIVDIMKKYGIAGAAVPMGALAAQDEYR